MFICLSWPVLYELTNFCENRLTYFPEMKSILKGALIHWLTNSNIILKQNQPLSGGWVCVCVCLCVCVLLLWFITNKQQLS